MFTPRQYREKALEYGELLKTASGPNERREFEELEQSFVLLANDAQWRADNQTGTVRAPATVERAALAQDEEHILRCLGAALILQWNTLPKKLRRELFDNAGTMGELLATGELRGKIARFLHKHKNDGDAVT